jgi:hypothetical protein
MKPDIDPHTITAVKTIMLRHVGSANRISYDALTTAIFKSATNNNRRKLRAVISEINSDNSNGLVICSDRTDGGLFCNGDAVEDIERHVKFILEEEAQAMSTLHKVHAYKSKVNRLYGSDVLDPKPGQGRLC